MKFPDFADLDDIQRAIYTNAPTDGSILVVGPPGTGKTVMAYHRANRLAGQLSPKYGSNYKGKVHVIMFNKVLSKYTADWDAKHKNVSISTMHKWCIDWWKKVSGDRYPPKEGRSIHYDWKEIGSRALNEFRHKVADLDWRHLIIDEGQDFDKKMYIHLNLIQDEEMGWKDPPTITVFADDNQSINKNNTTTEEIDLCLGGLSFDEDRYFVLRKNYRNTLPIHRLACHFEVGHKSGTAEDPEKEGPQPEMHCFLSEEKSIGFIKTLIRNRPGKEFLIIVPDDNRMVDRFAEDFSRNVKDAKVQRYYGTDKGVSRDHPDHKKWQKNKWSWQVGANWAKELVFGEGNTITILNHSSCKGLESDVVFLVGLDRWSADAIDNADKIKKKLYVACSRARDELYMIYQSDGERPPIVKDLFPPEESGLIFYGDGVEDEDEVDMRSI